MLDGCTFVVGALSAVGLGYWYIDQKSQQVRIAWVFLNRLDGGYYYTPLGRFSNLDTSTVGIVTGAKKSSAVVASRRAESFPKTNRSVLAPSCFAFFFEQSSLK